jgi:hypothetical protein
MKKNIKQGLQLPLRRLARIFAAALVAMTPASRGATPTIEITYVPSYGSCSRLEGRVLNADPATNAVAVFIYMPCANWWSKPNCSPALTPIQADGTWSCNVTTGGIDNLATNFVALLVSTNYSQPCVEGLSALPANVLAQALASASASRETIFPRSLRFSGYDWHVKLAPCLTINPGPCYYGDSTNQVWLDDTGRLHLRASYNSNRWWSAEVISMRRFGYGRYVFFVDTSIDAVDANAVWGCFVYGDKPCGTWREIDFEFTRWGNTNDTNNAQFVVQPGDAPEHRERFRVAPTATNSTHVFVWDTDRVTFQTYAGHSTNSADLIHEWTSTNAIPVPGDDTVRLNLYLADGKPPVSGQPVEVVISRFEWQPLLVLTNWSYDHGTFQFTLLGQSNCSYQVMASTDLRAWSNLATLDVTSGTVVFRDTNAATLPHRFYRAVRSP